MDFMRPTRLRQAACYTFVIFTLVFISCAEIAAPPGGPEDKSAPYIISSLPASGSTEVAPDNSITIFFSERISRPEGKRAVFISPRPASEPNLSWKSDRLTITLADSFAVNQTYIVSLSTDIVDMRRNRLDKSTTIAFSTGSTIDSGQVSGTVYTGEKPAEGVLVGLYDPAQLTGEIPVDSVFPEYLTQTSAGGSFSFVHLPSKEFRLIAFEDRNRDERLGLEREQFAVPDRVINTGGDLLLDSLKMTLTTQQVDGGGIASASYTADGMIRVRLATDINLEHLVKAPARVVLRPHYDSLKVITGQAVLRGTERVGSEFALYAGHLDSGVYILSVLDDSGKQGPRFDSLRVKPREDKQPPEMFFSPDNRPQFLKSLELIATVTEPVDTSQMSAQTFQLFDQEDKQLALESVGLDPLRTRFNAADIKAGATYRLKVTEFEISDNSGNPLGDSLREYTFTTLDPDSLGTIAGKVIVKLPNLNEAPIFLQFEKLDNKQTFDLPVDGREFKIDLPAGKYMANGFIDIDADGVRDRGSVVPFRFSETIMSHPDTIAVRARFETVGIELKIK